MKDTIYTAIDTALQRKIKVIEEGEHSYKGTPAELIAIIAIYVDVFMEKQKPHMFRRGDDIMVDIGRYQYRLSLKEILELEDMALRNSQVAN